MAVTRDQRMPIYEYKCDSCDQRTEAIQRLDDAPLAICPHCGGALRKLLSAPSFQFKGSGWYVTDYADESKKPPADSIEPTSSNDKDSGGETKAAKPSSEKTSEKSSKSDGSAASG